jgi:hypothetical protein
VSSQPRSCWGGGRQPSSPTGATIADGQGKGRIVNDAQPTIAIDDVTKAEGDEFGATLRS